MLKDELLKEITKCQEVLSKIEVKMNNAPNKEERSKLEDYWAEVYNIQKKNIAAIAGIDRLAEIDKIVAEKNMEEEKEEEVELPKIEEAPEEIELPQIEETTDKVELTEVEEKKEEISETSVENNFEEQGELTNTSEDVKLEEVMPVEIPQVGENKEEMVEASEEIKPELAPLTEEISQVNEIDAIENSKTVFVNETSNPTPGRKISVNEKQFGKLANSLQENKEKLTEITSVGEIKDEINPIEDNINNVPELDSEKQIEEMLNQQKELYNQGKVEEAEAMANDISVLTKKMAGPIE